MHLKPETVVLRLRIKQIDFKGIDLFLNLSGYQRMEITEFESCEIAALLIFKFLVFTNLASTLEELIFLSGFEINLDLLNFLILHIIKRKIYLQFYDYQYERLSIKPKLVE